jgi:GT2 family glycosyltransferase
MNHSPSVAVLILNWNGANDTIECLNSVSQFDYPDFYTLVVDNGSMDSSIEKIEAACPGVQVLKTGRNLGYAEGNNRGIQQAIERNADYVLILNNDTKVDPAMLTSLIAAVQSNSEIGIAGPTVFCDDPADRLFAAGSFIQWTRGSVMHRGMFRSCASTPLKSEPQSVDFIAGCGLLANCRMVKSVGALNPEYFLNFEDVEWAVRARRHGFQILHVPAAVMRHKISASLGNHSAVNTYYMTRNSLRFFWQNSPKSLRWIAVAHILFRTAKTVAAWTLKTEYINTKFKARRSANIFAMRDFFAGRYGPMSAEIAKACAAEYAVKS